MTRISKAALRQQEWESRMALPETPSDPAKERGPEVGASVIYHSRHDGDVPAQIVERSYIWSPEIVVGDHRGFRRYDLKVITFGAGKRLLVDDKDLTA
jgi:hypothetical protein